MIKTEQPKTAQAVEGVDPADWPAYGRTQGGVRYSPLTQINDQNVKDLKVAWTFRTGDLKKRAILAKPPTKSRQSKLATTCICVPHTSG